MVLSVLVAVVPPQVVRSPVVPRMREHIVGPGSEVSGVDRRPALAGRGFGAVADAFPSEHIDAEVTLTADTLDVDGRGSGPEAEEIDR